MIRIVLLLVLVSVTQLSCAAASGIETRLSGSADDINRLRAQRDSYPMFKDQYMRLQAAMDKTLVADIAVPVPADAGGGYTHEQHKKNYKIIHDAGVLFQLTGDQRYVAHARKILLAYAELYPSLGEHPKKKEQSPGRLFWQSLNEAVWLVYSIQGYDSIVEQLSAADRDAIESKLLRPMARFLSAESPQTFNKIHNHGTWAAAAVGMTGYVLGDQQLVEQALYGLDRSGAAGFYKQLDQLFSPDGYYTEGPYYQRYALMPFILFAKAVDDNEPQRKIFAYRNEILFKAVYTTIQLSYNDFFFPINDALTDKGLDTSELVYGVDIVYALNQDPALLSIAQTQGRIVLSAYGMAVAKGLAEQRQQAFPFNSRVLKDGAAGDQGALVIMRSGSEPGHQALVMKNTSQGMGHGHFDKLNWLFYDNSNEVVSDYGAARFLNVESKYGGHYLPENKTWAKQTIAHNTLVVDQTSHFNGKLADANKSHPTDLVFAEQESLTLAAASMTDAYSGIAFTRTMVQLKDQQLEYPLVIDVLQVSAEQSHRYDLPLYYRGHIVDHNFPLKASTHKMTPLGEKNGYQHLWQRAVAEPSVAMPQVSWLLDNRFYTYSFLASEGLQVLFAETGANDPDFNLRRETTIIQRLNGASNHTFVSLLETHGQYNPSLEFTRNARSQIAGLSLRQLDGYEVIVIKTVAGKTWQLALSYDSDEGKSHSLEIDGKTLNWQGFYTLIES